MSEKRRTARLAVDIGGTFTDIVLLSGERRWVAKLLTTPRAPEVAVIEGARGVLEAASLGFSDVGLFVHGTTLATNAIIERKGARTALIATDGFRDVIEIADEGRFDQYDINIVKPVPLVPRELRFTVPERMDVHGAVRLPLDESAVRAVARRLAELDIEAVAVALIHAYANPAHEERIGAILAELCPRISVTLSSQACPEAREYERTSTAIANAYVQPLMAGYLRRLEREMGKLGLASPIHLMTSGGSLASLETAARFPVRLVESGPAGGAILAGHIALARGERRILSFDMGGTTAKICLIDDGEPLKARTFEVDRQSRFKKGSGTPVRIPIIEMVEIGAGGGSIARVDALQRILVGPDSAGAEPGPACYGRGGTEPTVTDADLAIGKIDPSRFAGGKIAVDPAKAEAALAAGIGAKLSGMEPERAAVAVAEIVDENMANAARVHAVERGVALSDRTLVAFGGAAPLHASRIAEKLGITRIIVPPDAGVGSAIGFLAAPAAYELVRSRYMRLDLFDAAAATALIEAMEREAVAHASAAAGDRPVSSRRSAFMRYAGQGHEISVTLPDRPLEPGDAATFRQAFEAEYTRLFARYIPGAVIEIMSWVVLATTDTEKPRQLGQAAPKPAPAPAGERSVFDARLGRRIAVPVYERRRLAPGTSLSGPALVVEEGTSTYVSPSFDLAVDAGDALVLTAKT
ncbi:MAG TPA: hydantoinase/oxoprolinase family protein [Hyphomicrobiaceae bacterium]|nr:hydantoinase/oxoprolinase family protein [Hyphomicrobiaceae bacterium]